MKLLSELYRPPLELFFKGTFEQVSLTNSLRISNCKNELYFSLYIF